MTVVHYALRKRSVFVVRYVTYILVVRYAMCKANLAYLYNIISLLHMCIHAVPCSTSCGKSNFSLCKYKFTRGHWISPRGIVYMMRDLAMEACCTIHENDYWHGKQQYSLLGKHVVANYMSYFQLPCILQV